MVKVKFIKTDENAILPKRKYDSDSGYDIYSVDDLVIPAKSSATLKCGLKVSYITPGHWFSIRSRSGMAFSEDIVSFHGTIDNGYRNELGLKLFNFSDNDYRIKKGDRVCQMIIFKLLDSEVSFSDGEIDETERNENGFGSSGK